MSAKDIEKLISKFFVILYFFSVSAIFAIYYFSPNVETNLHSPLVLLLFGILVCMGVVAPFISDDNKVKVFLVVFSIAIPLILFESVMYYLADGVVLRERVFNEQGVVFDRRSITMILDDLRKNGVDGYPAFFPATQLEIITKKTDLFPLSSISVKATVYCNESGKTTIYQSDEHGFNNPSGVWNQPVDVMLIGDSFVHGACVEPEESIASYLRTAGRRTISLGSGGNGPLAELATLTEYVVPMHPKIVFWLYYEGNDLSDLYRESESPVLTEYVKGNFTQNLISNQPKVDLLIKEKLQGLQQELRVRLQKENSLLAPTIGYHVMKILKFNHIRTFCKISWVQFRDYFSNADQILKRVISLAKDRSDNIGVKLYFVYIPDYARGKSDSSFLHSRGKVLKAVRELNVPIIDIFEEVTKKQADYHSLYPLGKYGHYNAKGYKLIAEAIDERLGKDGFVASME